MQHLDRGADQCHAEPNQGRKDGALDKKAEATVPHIQYSELAVESNALAGGSFKSVYKARWVKKGRNAALLVLCNSNQAALLDGKRDENVWDLGQTQAFI
jgi:hypothetical protein